jgi:hypothetical protein
MCAEELSEDALGPRAAGTVASRKQAGTAPLTAGIAAPSASAAASLSREHLLGQLQRKGSKAPPAGTAPIEPTGRRAAPDARDGAPPSITQPLPHDGGTTDPTATSVGDPTTDLGEDGAASAVFTSTGIAEHGHESALVPAPPTGLDVVRPRSVPPAAGTTPIVRSRRPRWPWVALAVAIVTLASVVALGMLFVGPSDDDARASLPRTASLQVTSSPAGARLFVDGVEHGLTPTLVSSIMPGRAVHLEVRGLSGEVLDTREVELGEGETRAVELRALPPSGLVRVSSAPSGATVSIDGVAVGVTPLERELLVGEHRVNVALEGHATEDDVVRVEQSGDRASLSFALRPLVASAGGEPRRETGTRETGTRETGTRETGTRETGTREAPPRAPRGPTGTLRVTTTPWSEVFEGGRRLGETPMQIELPAGRHALTLRAEGRPAHEETVEIREGEVTRVRVIL